MLPHNTLNGISFQQFFLFSTISKISVFHTVTSAVFDDTVCCFSLVFYTTVSYYAYLISSISVNYNRVGMFFFNKDVKKAKKNYLLKNETAFFDDKGHKVGTSRKSVFHNGQTDFYDQNNKKVGYSRPSYVHHDETIYYDKNGKKLGTSRKNRFHDGVIDFYDINGRKIEESIRNDIFHNNETVFRKKQK